jgi:hypothetical protein
MTTLLDVNRLLLLLPLLLLLYSNPSSTRWGAAGVFFWYSMLLIEPLTSEIEMDGDEISSTAYAGLA